MLSLNSNGIYQGYRKFIIEHGEDVLDSLHYKEYRDWLEIRGVSITQLIRSVINILGFKNTSVNYNDLLVHEASIITRNANLSIGSKSSFLTINLNDVIWLMRFYDTFFTSKNWDTSITAASVEFNADLLIIGGWYEHSKTT